MTTNDDVALLYLTCNHELLILLPFLAFGIQVENKNFDSCSHGVSGLSDVSQQTIRNHFCES